MVPGVSPTHTEPEHPLRRASPWNGSGSSILASTPDTQSEYTHIYNERPGFESPPPLDEMLAEIKNERRYRWLLQHEFHPSRE